MRNAKARAHAAVTPAEVQKTDEQWRTELSPEQYRVLRQAHTERHRGRIVRSENRRIACS